MRVGLYLPEVPGDLRALDEWRQRLGEPLCIASTYCAWGGPYARFDADAMRALHARGLTPMVTWEPWVPRAAGAPAREAPAFTLDAIARGEHDAYVCSWADACRDVGVPLLLRPMHEMNGDWYPWSVTSGGGTPEAYVRAWHHLHDVFRARGAHGVSWVWSPYVASYGRADAQTLAACYPGDGRVDLVGLDGYNWGNRSAAHRWTSFDELFLPAYERVTALGARPVMIAEVGCATEGGDKAAWIRAMFATLAGRCPRVGSVVWFQCDKERDWRLGAPPESLAAFIEGAAD